MNHSSNEAALLKKAVNFHQNGNLQEAAKLYNACLQKNPNQPDALHLLGVIVSRTSKAEDGIKMIKKAIKLSPKKSIYYSNLANSLTAIGKFDEAEKNYKKAIKLNPTDSEIKINLGICYLSQQKLNLCFNVLKNELAKNSDNYVLQSNIGACLLQQGKINEAIKHLEKSHQLQPHNPHNIAFLGLAYLQLNKKKDAHIMLKHALALNPNQINALTALGQEYLEINQYGKAYALLDKAYSINPNHAFTRINLALACGFYGDKEKASKLLEEEANSNIKYKNKNLKIGTAYFKLEQADKALEYFKKSLQNNPKNVDTLIMLATLYNTGGNKEKALTTINKAIELNPNEATAYNLYSSISKEISKHNINHVENMLTNKNMPLHDKIQLEMSLYKMYNTIKDYENAGKNLVSFNKHKYTQLKAYTKEHYKQEFDTIKKVFTAKFLNQVKTNNSNDTLIFIVGMPRSGTTLVEQILASHSKVNAGGELSDINIISEEQLINTKSKNYDFNNAFNKNAEMFKQIAEKYSQRIKVLQGNKKHVTDKLPSNFKNIGIILSAFPNAKIIHCKRNPISTCFSCYEQLFTSGHVWCYNQQQTVEYYKEYEQLMHHWQQVAPNSFYTIEYENLVTNQKQETKKLLEFCNLPWENACLEFYKTKRNVHTASVNQVTQNIYKTSLNKWKPYKKYIATIINEFSENKTVAS